MLQHASLLQGLLTGMLIALPMAAPSTVLGHCAALGITSRRLPWRLGFATMLALPFLVPKDMLAVAQVLLLCLTALIVATGGVVRGALSQQAKRHAAPQSPVEAPRPVDGALLQESDVR